MWPVRLTDYVFWLVISDYPCRFRRAIRLLTELRMLTIQYAIMSLVESALVVNAISGLYQSSTVNARKHSARIIDRWGRSPRTL